jgi:hypothetical protein
VIPTAVIVTRGDIDLAPVLDSLPKEWPRIVWNNSEREDLKVYGHFAALAEVDTDYCYMQDDDAICPAAKLLKRWKPKYADRIFTNVKDGDTPWISWGAIFHKDLPAPVIQRYVDAYGMDDDVLLWCDLIFSALTPWTNVDLGVQHLPWYRAPNRMVMKPSHYQEQARILDKCAALISVEVAA